MANHDREIEESRPFTRRGFLGMSGGFTGALLGGRFTRGLISSAHADAAATSKTPVPPPDLSSRDGIPVVECSKIRGVKDGGSPRWDAGRLDI
jgi:hypothetical protein